MPKSTNPNLNIDGNEKLNNTKQSSKQNKKSRRPVVFLVVCSVLFMVIVTLGTFFYFKIKVSESSSTLNRQNYKNYEKCYAFIGDETEIGDNIYSVAKDTGELDNIYIDMISKRLKDDYSKEDLMTIAIESNVDGIILEADNTDSMRKLIEKADSKGIPVVTLMTDCDASQRKSFVQAGAYNIGKIYGKQVISEIRNQDNNIIVFINSKRESSTENIILKGIQDTLSKSNLDGIKIRAIPVDSTDSFSTEETIRSILMEKEEKIDVIICLDEITTTGVYQALIDYNKVGDIRAIGYYISDRVIKGIEQGVIEATVVIDTDELGRYGVGALNEYIEYGYVSEYFSVDSTLINKSNISDYIK